MVWFSYPSKNTKTIMKVSYSSQPRTYSAFKKQDVTEQNFLRQKQMYFLNVSCVIRY